jgi:hypothetical protein
METVAGVLFSLKPCLMFQPQKEFLITFAINYDVEEEWQLSAVLYEFIVCKNT